MITILEASFRRQSFIFNVKSVAKDKSMIDQRVIDLFNAYQVNCKIYWTNEGFYLNPSSSIPEDAFLEVIKLGYKSSKSEFYV